jgi:hypothetical protein
LTGPSVLKNGSLRMERVFGAVLEKFVKQVARTVLPEQADDAPEPEQTQNLELGKGQAGQQVRPAEAAKEVMGFARRGEEPVHEVAEEDRHHEAIDEIDDVLDIRVMHGPEKDQVEDRQNGQRADKQLIADRLGR